MVIELCVDGVVRTFEGADYDSVKAAALASVGEGESVYWIRVAG